jgi:hypothetical protein
MGRKTFIAVLLLILTISQANAQSYTLKSVGTAKAFSLQLHTGIKGKGALVQYTAQKDIIPLRLKSVKNNSSGSTKSTTYTWDEIYNGSVTGSYGLTQIDDQISNIWYQRGKDGKRFNFKPVNENNIDDKFILHNTLITFNRSTDDNLTFKYPDGKQRKQQLPGFDNPNASRNCTITDYNFDGYDDLGFSIPDAGMGVYRTFKIWLYNPATKLFEVLKEPNYAKSKCSELCDVTVDKKKKLFYTACRGGARWWQDIYQFDSDRKLIWVRSNELTNP